MYRQIYHKKLKKVCDKIAKNIKYWENKHVNFPKERKKIENVWSNYPKN